MKQKVKRKIQYSWTCDRCGSRGSSEVAADADAWDGAQLMLALHRAVAPDCPGGADSIRVAFGDRIKAR